jgi:hypothetical protein
MSLNYTIKIDLPLFEPQPSEIKSQGLIIAETFLASYV